MSERLRELIAREIERAGGWLSFARYMELALYAPGLGYYTAGTTKFGEAGDFVTAPEVSSVFGNVLARQCAATERSAGPPTTGTSDRPVPLTPVGHAPPTPYVNQIGRAHV